LKKKKILARGAQIVILNLLRKYFTMKTSLDITTKMMNAGQTQIITKAASA
jgi:hypothetical protein